MKKKLVRALLLTMLLAIGTQTFAATTNPFKDVKTNAWYYKDVIKAYEDGLIKGVTSNTFEPNMNITRSMLVSILYRLDGSPKVSYNYNFSDVAEGDWDADAVAWALQNDIVNKITDTTFGRNGRVTREELVKILYYYAHSKRIDLHESTDLSTYKDYKKVSPWAENAFSWAIERGVIGGKSGNTLAPQEKVTRAELAAILNRFCEKVLPIQEKTPCTITYYLNDGTTSVYKTDNYVTGDIPKQAAFPNRSGYVMTGWSSNPNGGDRFDFNKTMTGDVELFAIWINE